MSVLAWIIAFSVFGSLLSILAAGAYLLLPETLRARQPCDAGKFCYRGIAGGVAFIHLLPARFG